MLVLDFVGEHVRFNPSELHQTACQRGGGCSPRHFASPSPGSPEPAAARLAPCQAERRGQGLALLHTRRLGELGQRVGNTELGAAAWSRYDAVSAVTSSTLILSS